MEFEGRALVGGRAAGNLMLLTEPLSMWGGFDPLTGQIIDRHHPQRGVSLSGEVVAMPHGRGSSSASTTLAEAIRLQTAPAGFLLREADTILVLGSLVGAELYGTDCPVVVLGSDAYSRLEDGTAVEMDDGSVTIDQE